MYIIQRITILNLETSIDYFKATKLGEDSDG